MGTQLEQESIEEFKKILRKEEKAQNSVGKYTRDITAFVTYAGQKPLTKEIIIDYKAHLRRSGYKPASINSMLAAINRFVDFLGHPEYKVKPERIQRKNFRDARLDLTRNEYKRLIAAAGIDSRLRYIIETIGSTGIRVSELKYFTIEAIRIGEIEINNKGKIRTILIPRKLRELLIRYCRERNIDSGVIFRTKTGKPLDRSYIWSQMKKICANACVEAAKVFPHNLRRLFAKSFYDTCKDIVKLADVLGHSSITTTRIYVMETADIHRKIIDSLRLLA